MTELTVPCLPAQSDARQLSTLSTPLLFSHRLCGQEECQEAPTGQQPLIGQRLMELTFVTLTLCRCARSAGDADGRLSLYLSCFESAPQPDWQFSLSLSDESSCKEIRATLSAHSFWANCPSITLSRSGGENLEGVFWGALLELPLSLLDGFQPPVLRIVYQRGDVVSSPFADGSARLL